ncbi:MAG: hypothetical protein KKA84_02665 [Bacteroidetes bacterium]|nr:hypothetical protein [Bacteroidota bacterium]
MIKEILDVFRNDSLMERAYNRSFEMLHLTQEMFLEAKNVLRETDENNLDIDIDDQDSEVNKYQRDVRKDVFTHLALGGNEELASGLALVSIVIDIERIGDYTKNIASIAKNYKQKLHGGVFEERIVKLEDAVEDSFKRAIAIFEKSDEEAGRELIKEYKWVSKEADDMIDSLIREEDPNFTSGCAASLTMYLRSLKRTHSHLRNVVTSVVNPFHRIGFKPKKKK